MPEKVVTPPVTPELKEAPADVKDMTPEQLKVFMSEGDIPAGYEKDDRPKTVPKEEAPHAVPPAEAKPETKPEVKTPPAAQEETALDRVERLLAQPEDKVSLKGIQPAEQALYHQMRRDRKNRQRAESERDLAIKRSLELEAKLKAPPQVTPADVLKEFEGKDDEEVLTVKEVKERLGKITPPVAAPPPPPADPVWDGFLAMSEQLARKEHEDFDVVMELAQDLLAENPKALAEVGDALKTRKNPAEVAYSLIKSAPEFEALYPAAQARFKAKQPAPAPVPSEKVPEAPVPLPTPAPSPKAAAADKALAQPPKATRTTANVSAGGEPPSDELTEQQLLEMPDEEFRKLPKQQRQRYLKQFGGAPNPNV